MVLYPANIKIEGRPCVIIGGGRVAARKAASLLECGARVRVVSPELDNGFDELAGGQAQGVADGRAGEFTHVARPYQAGDLEGSFLVIAATDDEAVNRAVEAEAQERGLLLNVVDKPEQCNFYVPSSVRRGELMLTVSTGGQLPALSKRLRRRFEEEFPAEWAMALELLGEARGQVISRLKDESRKKECLTELAALDLVPLLRDAGEPAARSEIEKCISRYLA
ncbi:MAG: bifunctional precorrin-2 dehydrogenase/sirohydrochlorin ferrochelatase [Actinobacteria bacterium]|nr:bifunctional precorrin-2 dehydrogenase/sirohydrochlorin ferrochelatase [Actinomycetota bacterium]